MRLVIGYNIRRKMQQEKAGAPGKRPAAVRYASCMGHMGRAIRHEPGMLGGTKTAQVTAEVSAQVTTQVTAQVGTRPAASQHHAPRWLPDKSGSSKQKYRLTDKGRAFLEGGANERQR